MYSGLEQLTGGVNRLDVLTGKFSRFRYDPKNPKSISADIIPSLYDDGRGRLWIATYGGGLDLLDKSTGNIRHYKYSVDDEYSINSNTLYDIFEDSSGIMWIAGKGGLSRYIEDEDRFRTYNRDNGFPTNIVVSLQEDDEGNLWMGSIDIGLIKFDPETEETTVYSESDGIQGNSFYWISRLKTSDGQLFFGGPNGVNSFYPANVRNNDYIPEIHLTSLSQAGEKMDLSMAPEAVKEIRLDWRNNFFSFTFASLNYTKPEKNQYAYMLEGRDSELYYAGTNAFGRYTGLAGGEYKLILKGSNNDGIWNETGTSIIIKVDHPFWATWWFRALMIFLAVFLPVVYSLNRIRASGKRQQLLELQVAERKHSEEILTAEKERLIVTLRSIGDGVITTDVEGNVVLMNRVAEKLTGWIQQEAKGKPLTTVFHIINEQNRKPLENPVNNILIAEKIVNLGNHIVLKSKNGNEYLITESGAPIFDTNHEIIGIVLVFHDVTEEYQKDRQLLQAQKLESVGILAGGMAHDFNNVLNGIMSASQLLRLPKSGLNEKNLKYAEMITQASTRASDLISKLLAFSRKGKIDTKTLDIDEILNNIVAILEGTIDKKITISLFKDASDLEQYQFLGDLSAIESTFLNLGINASHAMPDGGEIHIKTKNVFLDQKYCDTSLFEITPGKFLQIEIKDSGCGIPKENLQKIFEPFYSTKGQDKGTGLGLSAVYGTIQDHYGVIEVHSEVGLGTTFKILLPCSEKSNEQASELNPIITGSGTILLVDDEESNRILNQDILESLGYNIYLAEDGLESIEIFSKKHSEIDIVLMDMIMPRMNGSEAFDKLKEIDENCKVIIASGYTQDENIDKLFNNGLAGFINKPYKISEISQLLNDIIKK